MVHALYDTVDHIRQFTLIVKLAQLIEIFTVVIVLQRMLNVAANCGIDVLSCTLIITEGNIIKGRIRIIKAHILHLERSAIFDITVNGINIQQSGVFSEWNKRCVNRHASIIQLISISHSKAKRICTGYNNLHAHHSIDIGKNRSSVDEIFHQSDLINEYILASIFA